MGSRIQAFIGTDVSDFEWPRTVSGLLDMLAAFDCVVYDLLLQQLEKHCGLKGDVLRWMTSFIPYRSGAASRIHRHVVSGAIGLLWRTARIGLRFTVVHLVHGWPEHCRCPPHTAPVRWWLPAVPQHSGRRRPVSNSLNGLLTLRNGWVPVGCASTLLRH